VFNKTVNGVLAALTKAVADLEVVAVKQADIAAAKETRALAMLDEADNAMEESFRASRVAMKLHGLLA
jgi:hypothetical protein